MTDLQETVSKLFEDVQQFNIKDEDEAQRLDLKERLMSKLREYDNEFYRKYNKIGLQEMSLEFYNQNQQAQLPDAGIINNCLMKNTFVSDGGYLTRYQRLNKITSYMPPEPPVIPPPQEIDCQNEFNFAHQVYLDVDYNRNKLIQNKCDKKELPETKFQIDYFNLMKQPQIRDDSAKPVFDTLNKNIQDLGGLEDTAGVMEQLLSNYPQQLAKHTIRIQRMKKDQLVSEIDTIQDKIKMKENILNQLSEKGKSFEEENEAYQIQIKLLQEKSEEQKKLQANFKQQISSLEKQGKQLQNDIGNIQKEIKKKGMELNKKDVKINRLQEEIDKTKMGLQNTKNNQNEKQSDLKTQNERLQIENKKIEKQIQELLQAFKKQLRLIDILKRQKNHLIAGQIFQYTEEQFVKAIEMGQKI